jgi:thiamine biosynthesis lipoprotein
MNLPRQLMLSRNRWLLILAAAVLCAGCEQRDVRRARSREIMGTFATITAVAGDAQTASAAVEAGYQQFELVNRLMSDYATDSEIGRLNSSPPGAAGPVSPETFACLIAAAEIEEASCGAFSCTCRPLVQLWKSAARNGRLPTAEELADARALIGARHLFLEEPARLVGRRLDGVQVDLGGIAKGYALDLGAQAMRRAGAKGGLLDLGGGILVFGRHDEGEPWRVGVRHPFQDGVIAVLRLEDRAVATSGLQQRFYEVGGRRYSHIIDPRTGWPAEHAACVTVVAEDGLTSDAWATALNVLTVQEGKALLDRPDGPRVEVMWITGDAANPVIEMTPGFRELLDEGDPLRQR